MGHPLTTAYTTLGPEGLQHSLAEPSVRMVFTNAALLPTLLQVVDDCPSLVWVVYDDEDTVDQVSRASERKDGMRGGGRRGKECYAADGAGRSGGRDNRGDGGGKVFERRVEQVT